MKSKNQQGFSPVEGLLIIVIVAILAGTGLYVYRSNSNTKDTLNLAAGTTVTATGTTSVKTNATSAVTDGKTDALQKNMASSVTVVIAGTDGPSTDTPAAAVASLSYLKPGTAPWDFALSATTLKTYQDGTYKQYFAKGTVVGQSANGYTVAFGVNSAGKVDTIFMSASTDQLQ